jgi:hypothetical protein
MAKKPSPPAPPDDDALAQALQKALTGELVKLHGTAAAPGIFPSGNPGKVLLEHAKAKGFIDELPAPKARAPRMGKITESGRGFVMSHGDPRKIAEALKAMLEAQGAALASRVEEMAREARELQQRLSQAEEAARAALLSHQQAARQLADLLREAPKAAFPPPAGWADDIVRLVREAKVRNPFNSPTLPALLDELRKAHPAVDLAAFHDALRRLHEARRIRLGGFTQPLATLPDSRNALYLDREVKFYVDTAE